MDHTTRSHASSASSTRVVDVLVPVALNQTYSYRVPRGMELSAGDVVCVPLGPREVYRPSYQVSRRYFENVNVSNTIVNTTVTAACPSRSFSR